MHRRQFLTALAIAPLLAPVAASASDPEERKRGGGITFVQLPSLSATITRANRSRGVITVEAGIDTRDAATFAQVTALTPRFRAAFNQFLSAYVAALSPGAPVNADYLATGLQRQTDIVLGKPGAKFLLGTVLMN